MRIKTNLLVSVLLLVALLLIACSSETTAAPEKEVDSEQTTENMEEVNDEPEEEEEFIPEESQQISEFPWDEEDAFKNAQEENDADVLIAGFVTVSEDYTDDERENIRLAANIISGTVLEPGEVFSQNETAGPYTEENGYLEGEGYVGGEVVLDFGGGVCNVATTLYNTSIASDLEIVERHNHSMPVSYVPYGQDAAVAYGYKDFKFKNNTDHPLLIWTELVDNRLYMAFYGQEAGPEVTWEHETVSVTETSTDYRTNAELDDGEEEVKDLGTSTYNPLRILIEESE